MKKINTKKIWRIDRKFLVYDHEHNQSHFQVKLWSNYLVRSMSHKIPSKFIIFVLLKSIPHPPRINKTILKAGQTINKSSEQSAHWKMQKKKKKKKKSRKQDDSNWDLKCWTHPSKSIWGRMSDMAIIPSSKNFYFRTRCYKSRISIQKRGGFRIHCSPPR
jgi:hypothetical protein